MAAEPFRWPVRVYYEDTDAGGVVYHSNYINFMERARTERLRAVGIELDALAREHGILFVVRSLSVDYRKPARFNELLQVTAEFEQLRSASILIHQTISRDDEELLCEGRVRVASISADGFRPRAMPEFLVDLLKC